MQHKSNQKKYSKHSYVVHGKFWTEKWDFSHHVVPPMSSSSTYRLETDERGALGFGSFAQPELSKGRGIFIYERLDEPTRSMLEERLAYVEDGEVALCFSSGMAAIAAAVGVLIRPGSQIVTHKTLYACTYSLFDNWLKKFNVSIKYIDVTDLETLQKAITPHTACIYFETPANPTLELIDIHGVADVVKRSQKKFKKDIVTIVDNTFATPFCQRPLTLGIDIVIHSLTKNICGFGTDIGGAVITGKRFENLLLLYRKDFGSVLSSKNAWSILVYGLPSLELRMKREQASALEIARFLQSHPKIERVNYPGLEDFPQYDLAKRQMRDFDGNFAPGNMIYFVLKSNGKNADKLSSQFVNYIAKKAYSITLAVSLGQIRTLIEKPHTMTHSLLPSESKKKAHIQSGGIRLSVGIEDVEDILRDLKNALSII